MSIALGFPRRPYIAATSGVSRVNQRSALASAMTDLAAAVVATGETLTVTGQVSGLPPQLSAPLSAFVSAAEAHAVEVIPLLSVEEPPSAEPSAPAGNLKRNVVGAMIVEQLNSTTLSPLQSSRAELFATHVARALTIVEDQRQIFLLPLRRRVGRTLSLLFADRRSSWIAAALMLIAAAGLLSFVKTRYEVEAKGC